MAPPTAEKPRVAAELQPTSWDPETGQVDVIFSTAAPVLRFIDGEMALEVLSLDPKHVRLGLLNSGTASVLDSHGRLEETTSGLRPTTESVVGVVLKDSVRLSSSKATARIQLADVPGTQNLRGKVEQGILRPMSLGAAVHLRELVRDEKRVRKILRQAGRSPKDPIRVYEAMDWEPYELSFVYAGADRGAVTQAADQPRTDQDNSTMTKVKENKTGEPQSTTPTTPTASGEESQGASNSAEGASASGAQSEEGAGTAEPVTAEAGEVQQSRTGFDAEVFQGFTPADVRQALGGSSDSWTPPESLTAVQVAALERQRISGIQQAAEVVGAESELSERLIADATPLAEARQTILNNRQMTQPNIRGHVEVTGDARDEQLAGLRNALEHRCGAASELTESGRAFRGMSLLRVGETLLQLRGHRLADSSSETILQALHTSGDFAALTADVANKRLQMAYQQKPSSWKKIAMRSDATDFKPNNRPKLADAPRPILLPEGAQIQYGTIGDESESWTLATYARKFGLSRQMMVNDDTSAMDRVPRMFGMQIAELEADVAWAQITGNPLMNDGEQLFSAAHKNLLEGSEAELSIDGLSAARELMRNQLGLDDATHINVEASYLIVPPSLETRAQTLTASLMPNAAGDVNPFASAFQAVIVEPRLQADSATRWYLAADPGMVEILEYGTLSGASVPTVQGKDSWDTDGHEYKVVHDFGAGVLEHRGLLAAAGA